MSVSVGELSECSPALRLDGPGLTRLCGGGLTLHGQGQNSQASTSVYGLRATPGDHGLTQRGEVPCGVHVPVKDEPASRADIRTLRQGQFGFHCATSRAGLTRWEPPVDHDCSPRRCTSSCIPTAGESAQTKHPRHAGPGSGYGPSRQHSDPQQRQSRTVWPGGW
jgi:hypothetical protein